MKPDHAYLQAARDTAQSSPDPSTKVGALILGSDGGTILGRGFNRFPDGVPATPEHYADRAFKYKHVRHAEVWAAVDAIWHPASHLLRGGTLYTSFTCCPECARMAIGLGIGRVVFPPLDEQGRAESWVKEWRGRRDETLKLLEGANVAVSLIHV